MATQVFVNLPTTDLARSRAFFDGLGWRIEPQFSDDNAICVVVSDTIYLMVLTREFFQTFTDKPIADPAVSVQVETALSRDSRDEVDALVDAAVTAGGSEPRSPQDLGFMYSRSFEDPDGNLFSAVHMDPDALPEQ